MLPLLIVPFCTHTTALEDDAPVISTSLTRRVVITAPDPLTCTPWHPVDTPAVPRIPRTVQDVMVPPVIPTARLLSVAMSSPSTVRRLTSPEPMLNAEEP